jgi:tight adherence protein C
MTAATAGCAGCLVLLLAWHHRPAPARVHRLAPGPPVRPRRLGPSARRLLPAVAAVVVGALVLPLAAPLLGLAAWAVPVVRQHRRQDQHRHEVRRALPEAVDLLRVGIAAGLNVPLAVAAVARRTHGPIGEQLQWALGQVDGGARFADALDDAADRLGPDARPLLAALAASDRYGAPLAEPLARLADDARIDRRRRAEEIARRIPVRLLFPLVVCVLPAFALLTVAPLIAGGLGSLRL